MDKETLIKVVAMLDAKITEELRTDLEEYDAVYNEGYIDALREISYHFQSVIDADVAAMESKTGE